MTTKIHIMLETAPPEQIPEKSKLPEKLSVEDRVRELIDCINSGYDSEMEWILLNKFYNTLQRSGKSGPRVDNLKKMIELVLSKFGYHKVSAKAND